MSKRGVLTLQQVVDRWQISYDAFRWMYWAGRVPYVRTPAGSGASGWTL